MAEEDREEGREEGAHSAVLDTAHVGDIKGAFGTIREHDLDLRRSWTARLLTLLAIMGPGLIVMVSDNDAGGVATYAQAGQNFGLTLLWTLPLLIPVLVVNQEMVVRLGAVTGVGHARLINERFGKFWGAFSVGERFMFIFIAVNFLVIPLAVFSHPTAGAFFHGLVVPGVKGGFNSTSVLLVIAIVGTTVAPWQLFFQQSNIVDKRITPRWINYERADTVIGSLITVFAAAMLMAVAAAAFSGTSLAGHFTNAGGVATGLEHYVGRASGDIFAIILLNASIIGAASVTLATSYAFGDVFGAHHSLPRRWKDAKFFYGVFTGMVVLAAGIVIIPGAPLGVITTGVQALAGVLLPSATVFLLLLCNDKEVLGPWVNRPWLNVLASLIVAILLLMSLVLMATTLFSQINVTLLSEALGVLLVAVFVVAGVVMVRNRSKRPPPPVVPMEKRATWRMPPLNLLERPTWSRGRLVGMYLLRIYLVVAVLLLLVKAIELA